MSQNVAIITGDGRGIGRAIAQELAGRGYGLVITARTKTDLDETAAGCGDALVVQGDVTEPAHCQRVVAAALERFGRIDAVVNNAGVAPLRSMEQITVDEWNQIMETNLSAAFYLIKAAWPVFVKQKSGVIVNISSVASRDPFAGLGAYGAAKAGLNVLGLALAREGAAHNIRVHTVAPGAVETQMLRKIVSRKEIPTEKTLTPEEVARVVAQCIGGELQYTSGEVIYLHKSS
jgi:NAD(P)-dependent dehydrogenase (short-subunit alcohol dehydrogenase family)